MTDQDVGANLGRYRSIGSARLRDGNAPRSGQSRNTTYPSSGWLSRLVYN